MANQLLPSHRAMRLTETPPAEVKLPEAYRLPSCTPSAVTMLFTPAPSGLHAVPSQRAMRVSAVAPDEVKLPAA